MHWVWRVPEHLVSQTLMLISTDGNLLLGTRHSTQRLPQTIMGSRKCIKLFVVVNKRQIGRNAQILLTSPELEIE